MKVLEIIALSKTYGDGDNKINALNNVSFSVEKGEFVAIVGQSGSGKSTLLHLIGGIDTPSNGEVVVNGRNIFKFSNQAMSEYRRREVSLIYQFYNLVPTLTVEENITLSVRLDHKKVDQERLCQLIRLLDLETRKSYFPNQLSGGQQQRVAIGRALYNKPDILLADEPTGNLDTKNSKEIIDYFKMMNEKYNQTILMITHDQQIAARAQRIIVISDGKIVSDEVKNEY